MAIKLLILALEERTKQLGKYIVYALIKNKSLIDIFRRWLKIGFFYTGQMPVS